MSSPPFALAQLLVPAVCRRSVSVPAGDLAVEGVIVCSQEHLRQQEMETVVLLSELRHVQVSMQEHAP